MANKMLVDANHPEETRVVVLRGQKVEEFDFESANREQLRGNIYLARVTRVEPSLQAAFVDYGGNRHGFLAFSEIHPDYYQIPLADRQALLAEEEVLDKQEEQDNDESDAHAESSNTPKKKTKEPRRPVSRARKVSAKETETADDAQASSDIEAFPGDTSPSETPAEEIAVTASEETAESSTDAIPSANEILPESADDNDKAAEKKTKAKTTRKPRKSTAAKPRTRKKKEVEAESAPENVEQEQKQDEQGSDDPKSMAMSAPKDPSVTSTEFEDDASEETQREIGETADSADKLEPTQTEDGSIVASADESDADVIADAAAIDPLPEQEAKSNEDSDDDEDENPEKADVESIGNEDVMEELPNRRRRPRRQYKIHEVIKRRQILLVQVVKEERGNKGAALTTYLSLAGRYSVLMPNTARGGGISRKITSLSDRKHLREIANALAVPEGMGVILRTAGANRTKSEIRRDFEYLLRLWESVRDLTLSSSAPCHVYEEGSLIKRSIRDLYGKDIDEVMIDGDETHREAKEFMRMMMPSHVKNIKAYKEKVPIFTKFNVEIQLDGMFSPQATLPSGGYIIINQTEALVAIDVNSGRATRERSIEETALQTNLEAAAEIARQLRLRDLAGLVVLDFIDMEENRNNRAVERRLKECLKSDRARIQIGRISHFGLLEMSRQRLRTGVLEGSSSVCPSCSGAGIVRTSESTALHLLRTLENVLVRNSRNNQIVKTIPEIALYLLNQKRSYLMDIEMRFGISVSVVIDNDLLGEPYLIEKGTQATGSTQPTHNYVQLDSIAPEKATADQSAASQDTEDADAASPDQRDIGHNDTDDEGANGGRRRRRRGRRGGRRNKRSDDPTAQENQTQASDEQAGEESAEQAQESAEVTESADPSNGPQNLAAAVSAHDRKNKADDPAPEAAASKEESSDQQASVTEPDETAAKAEEEVPVSAAETQAEAQEEQAKKSGWWQRRSFF